MSEDYPFAWVTEIKTVDAIDTQPVNAMCANPGWLLLHAGIGAAGQTVLTFAWPYPSKEQTP